MRTQSANTDYVFLFGIGLSPNNASYESFITFENTGEIMGTKLIIVPHSKIMLDLRLWVYITWRQDPQFCFPTI